MASARDHFGEAKTCVSLHCCHLGVYHQSQGVELAIWIIKIDLLEKLMAFPVKPEAALAGCFRNILEVMQPIFDSNDLLSLRGIDRDQKTLEKTLKMIQDVLDEAEWRSQTEGSVSDWMDDLRELIDCIKKFVDDMNIKRVRIEKQLSAKNYHSLDHQAATLYTLWDIMAYCTSKKKTISESITKFNVKLEEVAKEVKKLNLKPQTLAGTPVASFAVKDGDDIGPSVVESEIYGRQEDKDHVIELLMSANDSRRNYSVVSIVGMGGVGKTTLAGLVFTDERVKSHFDMQSWACVSDDFDFSRVVRELIEYISEGKTSKMTTAALLKSLKGMVTAKKVLFVLDDMWTVEAWEKLEGAFTHCAEGSKILVTTRNKNIGHAINDKEVYELQTLEDNYCWVLFKEKAFDIVVDESLEKIGRKIVEKCKGVPLAIKVIGSSLRATLGRYLKNPLAMIATLCGSGREILSWKLTSSDDFLSPDEKYGVIEEVMVDSTNHVGIDINLAASHEWLFAPLQFVSGLGPRKAYGLQRALVRAGSIFSRKEILLSMLLKRKEFTNAIGFLRVRQSGLAATSSQLFDLLDDTRIHPESYDLAKEMAKDVYNEEIMGDQNDADEDDLEMAIEHVLERPNMLKVLNIVEYARSVEDRLHARKRETLFDIKMELPQGFKDGRTPYSEPTQDEVFSMISGETDESLAKGRLVQATVQNVQSERIMCVLDSGLRGSINIKHLGSIEVDNLSEGTILTLKIDRVHKDRFFVNLVHENWRVKYDDDAGPDLKIYGFGTLQYTSINRVHVY